MKYTDDWGRCNSMNQVNRNHSLDDKFTFGKYKGQTIKDVCESDPQYVVWVAKNIKWFPVKKNIVTNCRIEVFELASGEGMEHDGPDDCWGIQW